MIFLIDSGHGGVIDGKYQTFPNKMFDHGNGEVIYEGDINRKIKRALFEDMDSYGLKYVDVCPTDLDLPLRNRVMHINSLASLYDAGNCLLVSLHSNAGGGRGFEVWTSPGETDSDVYATALIEQMEEDFPNMKIRKDFSDGDPDKESQFYILKNSICPAILPEFLFFDNYEDYNLLISPFMRSKYVSALTSFFLKIDTV